MSGQRAIGRIMQSLTLGAAAALLALAGIPASAAPALAADSLEVIELSGDGVSYTRSLSEVFGTVTLVPMSSASDGFWVRNTGTTPAYLTVIATDATVTDADLAGALTLSAGISQDNAAFRLPSSGTCRTLEAGSIIAPSKEARVSARLALGNLDGIRGQDGHIDFNLQVLLSDLPLTSVGDTTCPSTGGGVIDPGGNGGGEDGGNSGNGNGENGGNSGGDGSGSGSSNGLSTTGANLLSMLGWGAVLAALGFAIVVFKRRRPREE